ncbi:MAG: hypothetical protein ACI97Y_000139 [Pseudomonadales bacterium]|jgi:hypothetical protein|uniref:hypothetical protein n=1 Tax=Marinobacter psychrophilus TaxID=330734 RepID=UPI0039E6DFC6
MSISPSNNVHLTPNYTDNEQAAEYLRTQIGPHDGFVEWVALRPDGLIDEAEVSDYEVHASPTRSVIFDAGKTSRINVGYFMTELITDDTTWSRWVGKMPVIYNVASSAGTATPSTLRLRLHFKGAHAASVDTKERPSLDRQKGLL